MMMGVGSASGPGGGGGVVNAVVSEAVVLIWTVPAGLWTVRVTGMWTVVKPLAEPPG